jgi:hypothetical protein
MNTDFQWAGTAAAALIAIVTVVRWLILRAIRGARWVAALIELPETVDRLGHSVDTLTGSVDTLAEALHRHPAPR